MIATDRRKHLVRLFLSLILFSCAESVEAQTLLPGFRKSVEFDEQIRWSRLPSGVRVAVLAPRNLSSRPRRLVLYATPNGNSIEHTLGCESSPGLDWHFDIQQIAAQIRCLRATDETHETVLAVVQAPQLSWPTFRRETPKANEIIRQLVSDLVRRTSAQSVMLAAHSGGGSFVWGWLNSQERLPDNLERIVLLDANYSYSDADGHGEKILTWLKGAARRHLIVVAYDDRRVTLNGKAVVGPDGGTWRASQRMLEFLRKSEDLQESTSGHFLQTEGLSGQIQFSLHTNPDNRILHTALVGDMNGLLHGLTTGTGSARAWGTFGGPRAWTDCVQKAPFKEPAARDVRILTSAPAVTLSLPARPKEAPGGREFRDQIASLNREQREVAICREVLRGNVPEFLRRLTALQVTDADQDNTSRTMVCYVMSDYLAVGTDNDSFRLPMSPRSAITIATACHGQLLTTAVSDDIFAAATWRLSPVPLTMDRESVATFYQHHLLIEQQLQAPGASQSRQLVCGLKKDVVLTRRLQEKTHRVALYGWHTAEGPPIQPLYAGHVDWYVDYSHGIRLMSDRVIVDGREMNAADVLRDERLSYLLSEEGPLDVNELIRDSAWLE